jgi:hypothetical protein
MPGPPLIGELVLGGALGGVESCGNLSDRSPMQGERDIVLEPAQQHVPRHTGVAHLAGDSLAGSHHRPCHAYDGPATPQVAGAMLKTAFCELCHTSWTLPTLPSFNGWSTGLQGRCLDRHPGNFRINKSCCEGKHTAVHPGIAQHHLDMKGAVLRVRLCNSLDDYQVDVEVSNVRMSSSITGIWRESACLGAARAVAVLRLANQRPSCACALAPRPARRPRPRFGAGWRLGSSTL